VKKNNKKRDGIIVFICKEHLTCPFKVKSKRYSDGSWHISADSLNTSHICHLKHSDMECAVKRSILCFTYTEIDDYVAVTSKSGGGAAKAHSKNCSCPIKSDYSNYPGPCYLQRQTF
jgi:hypothetical protein